MFHQFANARTQKKKKICVLGVRQIDVTLPPPTSYAEKLGRNAAFPRSTPLVLSVARPETPGERQKERLVSSLDIRSKRVTHLGVFFHR